MRNIFSDPTATAAIARVDRERREAARRDKRDLDRACAACLRRLAREAREALPAAAAGGRHPPAGQRQEGRVRTSPAARGRDSLPGGWASRQRI